MMQQRQRQAEHYDCMAQQPPELQQNQPVHVQLIQNSQSGKEQWSLGCPQAETQGPTRARPTQ